MFFIFDICLGKLGYLIVGVSRASEAR